MLRHLGSGLLLAAAYALVACTSARRPAASAVPEVPSAPVAVAPPASTGTAGTASAEQSAKAVSVVTGDGRAALPEDWPSGTHSLKVREVAHVLIAPTERAHYIGKIVGGTRVAWHRVVAPDPEDPAKAKRHRAERCPAWVEIFPQGFLCKTLLVPSPDEPSGVPQPVLRRGQPTPDDYFKVMADDTKVYKSEDDVRAEVVDKLISTKVMLVGTGVIHIDETPYLKTDHGLIEATALGKFWPSDFQGLKLADRPSLTWPFAWVFFERGGRKPPVYATPDSTGDPVRSAARREVVPVLEERNGFVRIAAAEWIERKHLRVAVQAPPPAAVSSSTSGTDQWLDVDLDEQVLVAYEGKTPVFATLVSTGGHHNPTPVATYRVRAKAATTPMDGDPKIPDRYEVSAVPWAVRFRNGLFVHGVYWHDGFGGARSHGCVNVSPKDAAFIYKWIGPAAPDGWSEVEVPAGAGAIVRVRDREHPDPPVFDYTHEEPWNAAAADPTPSD